MRDCTLLQFELNSEMVMSLRHDGVSEIYSPLRVVNFADEPNFVAGWSHDLFTRDDEGKGWDFPKPYMRQTAKKLVERDQPTVVMGSPTCTNSSCVMNFNWPMVIPPEKEGRIKEAMVHVSFCLDVHHVQHKAGIHFLHEPPCQPPLGESQQW